MVYNDIMARTKQPLTKGEKLLLFWVGVFIAVIGGGSWWWIDANTIPHIDFPTPVMPVPNARDDFLKATTLLAKQSDINDAMSILGGKKPRSSAMLTPALIDAALKANGPALAALRAGFANEYREKLVRDINMRFPHYATYRQLARTLCTDSMNRAKKGDATGAMRSGLDGIEFGTMIPQGGTVITDMVGIACVAITREPLWEVADTLTASDAITAATRLERILDKSVPLDDVYTEEKWATLASTIQMMHDPNWRKQLGGVDMQDIESNVDLSKRWRFYTMRKGQIITNYNTYMDQLIANAKSPYAGKVTKPRLPNDPINEMFLPIYDIFCFKHTQRDVYNRLLLLKLALHAYDLDHKRYPVKLTALVHGYLTALPDDPYAVSGTFQYKVTKKGYLLYSIGPDSKDDGGTPCKEGQRSASTGTGPLKPTSTGDIVAGINVQ